MSLIKGRIKWPMDIDQLEDTITRLRRNSQGIGWGDHRQHISPPHGHQTLIEQPTSHLKEHNCMAFTLVIRYFKYSLASRFLLNHLYDLISKNKQHSPTLPFCSTVLFPFLTIVVSLYLCCGTFYGAIMIYLIQERRRRRNKETPSRKFFNNREH